MTEPVDVFEQAKQSVARGPGFVGESGVPARAETRAHVVQHVDQHLVFRFEVKDDEWPRDLGPLGDRVERGAAQAPARDAVDRRFNDRLPALFTPDPTPVGGRPRRLHVPCPLATAEVAIDL